MSDPNQKQLIVQQLVREGVEARERQERDESLAAIERCRERLQREGPAPGVYRELARQLEASGEQEEAIALLQEGVERCPEALELYQSCMRTLARANRTQEAIAIARRAEAHFPDSAVVRLEEALMLPRLYRDGGEIDYYRERYAAGLDGFIGGLRLDTPAGRGSALEAISGHENFYLPAQGRNDVELNRKYGQMVHAAMAACYPEWVRPRPMPGLAVGEKIRVGYISTHFYNQSVHKTHFGWIRNHDRDRFEVFSYYAGENVDFATEDVRRDSHRFFHAPGDLEAICQAILADRLHVAVFLDIGMDPIVMRLAALRLAPVQAATWGHPVTSGLPTVEYYLSSELMEPEDGQSHYTEQLVRLPGIGICYEEPRPRDALMWKTRSDFGIREDAVVYLSCQQIHKYLPGHYAVFARIAKRVEAAQFVFLTPNAACAEYFRRRMERAFAAEGLPAAGRLVLLPPQNPLSYWNLNRRCDIFLDTMEWSGCNTTLEAIACRLPVVTAPGELMRGRHSYAILTQLGVTDTIAVDAEGYIEIAVRLGLDRPWRAGIVERMAGDGEFSNADRPVRALENWYRRAVESFGGAGQV